MPESPDPKLSRETLEKVIQRATELQMGRIQGGDPSGDLLSEAEILRIGSEVGLDESHLRQALGEIRAQRLVPALPPESGASAALFGTGRIQVSRVMRGEPSELARALHLWLRKAEGLQPLRHRDTESLWEPSSSFEDMMRRAFSGGSRRYVLASLRSFGVSMTAMDSGWTLITLTADASNRRNEAGWGHVVGFGAIGLLPGLAAGIPLGVGNPAVGVLTVALGIAAGAWGGAILGKRNAANARARIQIEMEGLLDRAERGDLTPQSLRQRLGMRP